MVFGKKGSSKFQVQTGKKQWAAQQLYKCVATKVDTFSGPHSEHVNYADLSSTLSTKEISTGHAHESRIITVAWDDVNSLLATSGCDGTVRIWSLDSPNQPFWKHTLVFHLSENVFGCELQDKVIEHLKWAPTGNFIAAALENVINIWPYPFNYACNDNRNWFVDNQHEFITAMAWPKHKRLDAFHKDFLLVGKINGSVSLISLSNEKKEVMTLVNCCLSRSKWTHQFRVLRCVRSSFF